MAKRWMFHWIPPYRMSAIRNDCANKIVMLVWDETLKAYTSTFQMYVTDGGSTMWVRKIATLPIYEGRGIGRANMLYMEKIAKEKGCSKIKLDVYAKSVGAIAFYKKMGFETIGTKRSVRFKELIMEKNIE